MTNLIGQTLGRYRILEQIGRGGMAVVYKAYDPHLQREVAVKLISPGQEQVTHFQKRFEREARALASLSHPNIVRVLDFGEYEGQPYLVMEYIPGGTLKERTGQPLPVRQAASLLAPIARALAQAHARQIIHRDVKPANILFTGTGEPLLTDFGLAKSLGGEETTELTSTGVGLGTPAYMSPEQGLGEAVDHRTDIYSLGVVFYELITGRKPYQADTPMAVLHKQLTEPLVRPSRIVPGIPAAAEDVLIKALAKEPAGRYQSMDALAQALESLAGISREDTGLTRIQPDEEATIDAQPSRAGTTTIREPVPASRSGKTLLKWLPLAGGVIVLCLLAAALAGYLIFRNLNQAAGGLPQTTAPANGNAPIVTNIVPPPSGPDNIPTVALIPTAYIPPTDTQPPLPTAPTVETFSIGSSVQGRSLDVTRVGDGPQVVVITGAIHGSETNTIDLVNALARDAQDRINGIPQFTFYFLPAINPDGVAAGSRYNVNWVDLNRNWDTSDWQADSETGNGIVRNGGGKSPLSEPETRALATWLLDLKANASGRVSLFNYQAQFSGGLVIPSFTPDGSHNRIPDQIAAGVGSRFASRLGYQYSVEWLGGYRITGALANWCGENGITCLDIELPTTATLSSSQVREHMDAILGALSP